MKTSLKNSIKFTNKKLKVKSSPAEVYRNLYLNDRYSFLYESLESSGKRGRYSFIGGKPFLIFKADKRIIKVNVNGLNITDENDPFDSLRYIMSGFNEYPELPGFCGGAVGYISYDSIRYFEDIPDSNPDEIDVPDFYFIFPSEIITFDHEEDLINIIVMGEDRKRSKEIAEVISSTEEKKYNFKPGNEIPIHSNFTQSDFCNMVNQGKEYILSGDIFQVVLSQRLKAGMDLHPMEIYNRLRFTNPSPYMYYLSFNDLHVLGSSPETLIKLEGDRAISRPLAGTRPRGDTREEDLNMENELLNDPKEIAEHIMLVDLARNDLGRVCRYGSVETTELLQTEKYSTVMHIVSKVTGKLRKDKDAFDLFRASFPAGTVSGAPKIRAMKIIDELETVRREIYAGGIGYFSFNGNMDFCIAIRTIVIRNNTAYIQGGAGIVFDSLPEREYRETMNKMNGLKRALELER